MTFHLGSANRPRLGSDEPFSAILVGQFKMKKVSCAKENERESELTRVMVVGTSCSGKTVFARDLARRLNVGHIELDALYWLPGWVPRETSEFKALVAERARAGAWVADGNYGAVRALLWSRATTIIWLDYPFAVVFRRAIRRTLHRIVTGQKVCGDNRESMRVALFSRHSILLWVITTYRRRKRDYRLLFDGDDYRQAARIELTSPAAATAFLERIAPA
jgi:adenylate kinase family enzyme